MSFESGKYIDQILTGCALLSGRILPSSNHKRKNFIETPLIITHGDQDNVLPPKYFHEACNILDKEGYSYESHLLEGEDHTISIKTIHLIKNFIKNNIWRNQFVIL